MAAWSSGRRDREQGRVQTHREDRTTHAESADDDRGLLSNQGPRSRAQKGQQKYLTHDSQEAAPAMKGINPQVQGAPCRKHQARHIQTYRENHGMQKKTSYLGNTSENAKFLVRNKRTQE